MSYETQSNHLPKQCHITTAFTNYSYFSIKGPDALTFLQGQLTCNVEALAQFEATYGAHCNPKGRMISQFLLMQNSENTYTFRVHTSLYEQTKTALKKYMVFSKAKLTPNEHITTIALVGSLARENLKALRNIYPKLIAYDTNTTYIEVILDQEAQQTLNKTLSKYCVCTDSDSKIAHLKRGVLDLELDLSEKYLPQELNLDHYGGVSYKKGCYTGQEIIARLHYLGTLKKRLRLGYYEGPKHTNNTQLYHVSDHDQAQTSICGQILKQVSQNTEHHWILAVITDDAFTTNNAYIDENKTIKIQWHPLPYAIPIKD